jgi:hypothetical protein
MLLLTSSPSLSCVSAVARSGRRQLTISLFFVLFSFQSGLVDDSCSAIGLCDLPPVHRLRPFLRRLKLACHSSGREDEKCPS